MRYNMEKQIKNPHQVQDDIIRRYKESRKKVEEACPDDVTLYKMAMEIFRGFYFHPGLPSPSTQNE
jgi:hypothetical protein